MIRKFFVFGFLVLCAVQTIQTGRSHRLQRGLQKQANKEAARNFRKMWADIRRNDLAEANALADAQEALREESFACLKRSAIITYVIVMGICSAAVMEMFWRSMRKAQFSPEGPAA